MIYIWLKHVKKMLVYNTLEEFWDSRAYEVSISPNRGGQEIFAEKDTALWED